jgi:hypothetical protein
MGLITFTQKPAIGAALCGPSGSPRWGFVSSTSLKRVINGSSGARRVARFKDRADKTWVL